VKTAELGWALTREAGASILTYELYPLGVVGGIPKVPSLLFKSKEPKIPILLIHGVLHNRSTFAWMVQRLAWEGWAHFREVNLFTTLNSIPRLAESIAWQARQLADRHGVPQIDIVAHSMGGIIARYFVQQLGGDGLVRHLITLGTPHQGTKLSRLMMLPQYRELYPGSRTLQLLNANPIPAQTQALAISGNLDFVMFPKGNHFWPGVRNVELKNVGHAGLLFSRRVAKLITTRLDTPPVHSENHRTPPLAGQA